MGKIISIKSTKNQPKFIYIFIFVILLIIFLLVLLTSPIFSIDQIIIHGNNHYSEEQIMEKMDIQLGKNIFLFNKRKVQKVFLDDPYIQTAKIKIIWPNKLQVKIDERKLVGYVPYIGTYLYIDKDGRVLETASSYKENLPIVQGIEFDHFKVGDIIPVKNEASLNVIATMGQLMLKYDLLEDIIKIDVSNPMDIHLYVKKLDVSMGNIDQLDKKIQWLIKIMDIYDMGKVDLKNIDKGKAVFSPLT